MKYWVSFGFKGPVFSNKHTYFSAVVVKQIVNSLKNNLKDHSKLYANNTNLQSVRDKVGIKCPSQLSQTEQL